MNILDKIVAVKREEVAQLIRERDEALTGLHILPDTGIDVIENSCHQWPEFFSLLPSTP